MDTNSYNYYEEEEEISLVDLIAYVFRHLKKMLIVSIVVGLVLGGLLGYKKSRVNEEEYATSLETYLASKEILNKKIDLITNDLSNYVENSSFFDLNTENSIQAKALYLVDTGYQVIPSSTYQNHDYTSTVINAYINKITSSNVLNILAKKYNIGEDSINDYIYVTTSDYMIDINVYYDNEKDALDMLHDLEDVLLSYNDEISSNIAENNLTKISETTYQGANNNIVSVQQNKLTVIDTYIESLNKVKSELSALNEPENTSFKKSFIKFGAIGFVGIFFVMCVYYALAFIFSDKVYSANEFKDKTKIKVLGDLTFTKTNSKYINWINKLEKRPTINDYELIASNIKAYGNTNKVLISGNLEDCIKEDIVSNLKKLLKNVEIISCGSLLTDSSAVNELDSVDSVILLAKCNKSSYKTIKEEKNKLNDLKVTNVYSIVVE